MLPHIVAGTAITYMDRLVVSSQLGTESLGIYMVAMQVGMGMIALIEPLNKALAPWLFERLSKGANQEVRHMIVQRTYQLYIALAIMGILGG
jgi:O-antigen/teichoic acid export membrane protein